MAHAAVVGLHSLCCGAPVVASIALASGATMGAGALGGALGGFHALVHGHEFWILAVSAALVAVGAAMEGLARRSGPRPFPWLFAASVGFLALNAALIACHRLFPLAV